MDPSDEVNLYQIGLSAIKGVEVRSKKDLASTVFMGNIDLISLHIHKHAVSLVRAHTHTDINPEQHSSVMVTELGSFTVSLSCTPCTLHK